ncbi:Hypothetical predicted protein [Paramuricea clavata]|uniref:Uncharacterized protein n=1 Tax=Paramuricea clavata TaxID=317549 RepID=A0A6S7FQD2_PARCT|nr:Hypothetical predicted protein [Paramuricea clavata]
MADEIVGFLHNLSPLKHSDKTKYFDVQVQTKNGIVRGICFAHQKRGEFETFSNTKSPVKMKNVSQKDEGHHRTILMNSRTQLEETNVDFDFVEIPPIENISSLSAINENQLVTLKAKVVQLSGEKIITTRSGPKKKREGFLVDPFGSIRIVIWESFCEDVEDGETYNFKNIRVKNDSSEVYVTTPPNGCSIVSTSPFEGILVSPSKLPDSFTTTTVIADIEGISNFNAYISCRSCNKKIHSPASTIVKCGVCDMRQKKETCPPHFHLQMLLNTPTGIVTVTIFDDIIAKIVTIDKAVLTTEMEEVITSTMLALPAVEVSFKNNSKIVTDLKVPDD